MLWPKIKNHLNRVVPLSMVLVLVLGASVSTLLITQNNLNSSKSLASDNFNTLTLPASEDSLVKNKGGDTPNKNYNSAGYIRTKLDSDEIYVSYIKFNFSSITTPVPSATFRLFAYDGSKSSLSVSIVQNNWSESAITWNTQPPLTQQNIFQKNGPVGKNTWVEFNVTQIINDSQDKTITFRIENAPGNDSDDSVYFYNREAGAMGPQLVFGDTQIIPTNTSSSPIPTFFNPTITRAPTQRPISVTPTPFSISPTQYPTQYLTPPPRSEGQNLWISRTRIMSLPTSGSAWERLRADAYSDWGSPCLYDNNCEHDVKTYAGALVGVRLNDQQLITKTINALNAAINQNVQTSRVLELSRGVQSYVIAADVLGYRTTTFESNLRYLINLPLSGHSGGKGLIDTAEKSANNWGFHSRASGIAAALYLNDTDLINRMISAHNDIIGISHAKINYTDTNWHNDASNKSGVNRMGATINGVRVSGVIAEDWRRGGEFKWPPSPSGYMWEANQGYVVETILLHNANKVPITAGNNALVREMNMLYGLGEASYNTPVYQNPPSSDDTWIPYVVNYYAGTSYPEPSSTSPGKGMGYTDWTHQ